jgi:hypothetical protein
MRRRPLLAIPLLIALAGCVQARAELELDELGGMEGFVELALPDEGRTPDEVLADIDLDAIVATPGVEEGNRIEQAVARGGEAIVTLRFATEDATSVRFLDDQAAVTRTPEGGYSFDLAVDTADQPAGSRASVAVEFPYEVTSTNGEREGSTVRWQLDEGTGVQQLVATTNDELFTSSSTSPAWLLLGFAVAAAAVLGGGYLLKRRS